MRKKILKRRKPNRSWGGDFGIYTFLGLFAAFMVIPMIYTINSAFKPMDEIFLYPPRFFVRNPTMDNFQDLLVLLGKSWVPFSRYLFNTVFITIAGTAGHIIIASMGAFVLSKYRFPGSMTFFRIVVTALMFNGYVTSIPNYLVIARLGWVDTVWAVVIPAFAAPMGLFLMKQYMDANIPDVLIEAAKVDGAKEWAVFTRIAMPLVKPAWLTLMIFSVQNLWNARGSTFIYSEQLKTLPYALGQIAAAGIARAGVAAAVSVVMMIVPVATFIIVQSNVMETMATSGIKD
ncbi:MAG: carbohydrate ABC transporter permease [Clostridiales bacterium]|nr:carbohydrate ABC transporter permease [Clostridiales bacterium]